MAAPLVGAIGGMLISAAGSIAVQVLIGLGIGVATYAGVDVTLTWLKTQALTNIQALPANMIAMLALLKVGVFINLIFSAMVMRAAIQGMKSGAFKKFVKT